MAKLSMNNLLKKDLRFVEKKKIFFIIPICLVIVGIIAGIIFGVTKGSPFNMGMDFTGGYVITINTGTNVNDDNYDEYSAKIEKIVTDYRYEYDSKEYPVVFGEIQKLGSGSETKLRIEYRAHKSIPRGELDSLMENINEDLVDSLNAVVGVWAPTNVEISGSTATVTYDNPVEFLVESGTLKTEIEKNGLTVGAINFEFADAENPVYKTVKFTFSGATGSSEEEIKEFVTNAATIEMYFSAKASSGEMVGGSVRMELIYSAILAILITLVLMLVYIFIRFEFASGVAAVIALAHDIIIMFVFMTVFRIEINSTIIAVVITLLAYSINNTIIIFDRVRENRNEMHTAGIPTTATLIANKSIKETITRNIYTTFTTLIMIGMVALVCAIGGISSMVTFALPIIFGLLAGFYSSLCIAPALWVIFKRNNPGVPKRQFTLGKGKENK